MSLFDLPTRDLNSPIPSTASDASSNSVIRKQKFDDRSQTKISLELKSYLQTGNTGVKPGTGNISILSAINWSEFSKISEIINANSFIQKYGIVNYVKPSSLCILLGTDKAHLIGFSYQQKLEFILAYDSQHGNLDLPSVTAVSFSADSTYLAVGYSNGQINIWDLSIKINQTSEILYTIYPITLVDRFAGNKQGHLNVPINHICFIGDSYSQLISSDMSGLVFYHHAISKFFQKYVISEKLIGTNDTNANNSDFDILGCEILPLGTSHQITDQIGMMALLTYNSLVIVSVLSLNNPRSSNLKTHYKVSRSKLATEGESLGTLDWYPCMKIDEKNVENARLAYSWNNVLTIIEVENNSLPSNLIKVINDLKDKDKGLAPLAIRKTARWLTIKPQDTIVRTKWLTSSILLVFVQEDSDIINYVLHYENKKLHVISIDRAVPDVHPNILKLSCNHTRDITDTGNLLTWENSIQVYKQRIFLISDSKIYIGRPITWADTLLLLLKDHKYSQALDVANEYYHLTDIGTLALIALPSNHKSRESLIKPYLISIMKESIAPLLSQNKISQSIYVNKYLDIVAYLSESGELTSHLQEILEAVYECSDDKSIFFEVLQQHVLSNSITSLPPTVLKSLVETYVLNDKGDLLTEILCILDLKSLDIDLTVQLCKKYKLRDCLIYIWNELFNDYSTPLKEFIQDILEGSITEEDALKVYAYMSYILTGRQYPTDQFIDYNKLEYAKSSVCDILFSDHLLSSCDGYLYINDSYTIFPYLYLFLRLNSFEMVSTLNEFFEDSYLNQSDDSKDKKISRQYIVEALLDIYEAEKINFSDFDRIQLSIFIARNYSKYSQFLRLSESVLSMIIETLCNNTDQSINSDCELALQSILPFYETENEEYLIERLTVANYFDVLMNLYRSNRKYGKVLEIWLTQRKFDQEKEYENISSILENAFQLTYSPLETLKLVTVIKQNFKKLIEIDLESFIDLIHKYAPELHSQVLNISDEKLEYRYLNILFGRNFKNIDNFNGLLERYIQLSCYYQRNQVHEIVDNWKEVIISFDSLNKIYEALKGSNLIDSLSLILIAKNMHEDALIEIIDYMEKLADTKDKEDEFMKYLSYAMKCCEQSPMEKSLEKDELNVNEKLWLKLINKLVIMANEKNNKDYLNKSIHDCFRRISDVKLNPKIAEKNQEQSFLIIFNEFLGDLSNESQLATLSSIRGILHEVFVSYAYESEMLEICSKMLNEATLNHMNIIKSQNLRGWNFKSKKCASCSKMLWGSDIIDDHYLAWESKQRLIILPDSNVNKINQNFHYCQLILFKCKHGYHSTCLQNLNGGNLNNAQCIVCCG